MTNDETEPAPTCVKDVYRERAPWGQRWAPCGKPAKGEHDGESLCGVHLGVIKRALTADVKRRAEADARQACRVRSMSLQERLATLGVSALGIYWDDALRLSFDECDALIKRLDTP